MPLLLLRETISETQFASLDKKGTNLQYVNILYHSISAITKLEGSVNMVERNHVQKRSVVSVN